jgi:pilus assembly protein Flp/PilA
MYAALTVLMGTMASVGRFVRRRQEDGASLVEYALLLALIAVVALVALKLLGGSVANTLNNVTNSINNP